MSNENAEKAIVALFLNSLWSHENPFRDTYLIEKLKKEGLKETEVCAALHSLISRQLLGCEPKEEWSEPEPSLIEQIMEPAAFAEIMGPAFAAPPPSKIGDYMAVWPLPAMWDWWKNQSGSDGPEEKAQDVKALPANKPDELLNEPWSGTKLIDALQISGTGEGKLQFARALVAQNQEATAAEVIQILEANKASEGTLAKARMLVSGLNKPLSLNGLVARLNNVDAYTDPKYRAKFLDSIPEWPLIKHTCKRLFFLEREVNSPDVQELVNRLQFEVGVQDAGNAPLADILPHVRGLLTQKKEQAETKIIRNQGMEERQKGRQSVSGNQVPDDGNNVGCTFQATFPKPRPIPENIHNITDLGFQQRAKDAWVAASQLRRLMEQWEIWFHQLQATGDANPGLAIRLSEAVATCVYALCGLGVNLSSFTKTLPKELLRRFPCPPFGELEPPELRDPKWRREIEVLVERDDTVADASCLEQIREITRRPDWIEIIEQRQQVGKLLLEANPNTEKKHLLHYIGVTLQEVSWQQNQNYRETNKKLINCRSWSLLLGELLGFLQLLETAPSLAFQTTIRQQVATTTPANVEKESKEVDEKIQPNRAELLQALEPSVRLAYLAYCYAETKLGKRLEDREAFNFLQEEGIPDDKGNPGDLNEYKLPSFGSWTRYLSEARKILDERKYNRRAGRATGKSIVKSDEIEYLNQDSE